MGISSLESKPPNPLRAGRSPPPACEGKGAKGLGGNGAKSEPVLAAEVLTDKTLRFSSVQAKALEGHPRQFLAVLTHLLPPSLPLQTCPEQSTCLDRENTKSYPMAQDTSQATGRAAENEKSRQACPEKGSLPAAPPAPSAGSRARFRGRTQAQLMPRKAVPTGSGPALSCARYLHWYQNALSSAIFAMEVGTAASDTTGHARASSFRSAFPLSCAQSYACSIFCPH